jgi:hypothetical protein
MTLTAHSLIAAAIISKVGNPALGLPLVFVSHFVMDKVPHWDVMTDKKKTRKQIMVGTVTDIFTGFIAAFIFTAYARPEINPAYFFSAVFVSQLPDLLEAPYLIPRFSNPISKLSYEFQHWVHDLWFDARTPAPWGVIIQLAITGAFLLWAVL